MLCIDVHGYHTTADAILYWFVPPVVTSKLQKRGGTLSTIGPLGLDDTVPGFCRTATRSEPMS